MGGGWGLLRGLASIVTWGEAVRLRRKDIKFPIKFIIANVDFANFRKSFYFKKFQFEEFVEFFALIWPTILEN